MAGGGFLVVFTHQFEENQGLTIVSPDFGDAESSVNGHAGNAARSDIRFNGKVRGRVNGNIEMFLAEHSLGVRNVESTIWFQPAGFEFLAEGGRPYPINQYAQISSDITQDIIEKITCTVMLCTGHANLQIALIVGEEDMPFAEDITKLFVLFPGDVVQQETI